MQNPTKNINTNRLQQHFESTVFSMLYLDSDAHARQIQTCNAVADEQTSCWKQTLNFFKSSSNVPAHRLEMSGGIGLEPRGFYPVRPL